MCIVPIIVHVYNVNLYFEYYIGNVIEWVLGNIDFLHPRPWCNAQ